MLQLILKHFKMEEYLLSDLLITKQKIEMSQNFFYLVFVKKWRREKFQNTGVQI
jgi:hypothetical protein